MCCSDLSTATFWQSESLLKNDLWCFILLLCLKYPKPPMRAHFLLLYYLRVKDLNPRD